MNRDDNLWKAILEEIFDDFLLFFYPDAIALFDFNKRFEYLDKELAQLFPPEDNSYKPRYVDKLIKVFTVNNKEEWLLVHIEVQGQKDNRFARRMFEYYYRILDKYDKPITAFAVFSDGDKGFHPSSYETEVLGTRLNYSYNTYKIIDQDDEALKASSNPFALVVLTVKTALKGKNLTDEMLFPLKRALVVLMKEKGLSGRKQVSLLNFLKHYVRFDNTELIVKFDKELEHITGKITDMNMTEYLVDRAEREGIEKGIEKGAEQERRAFISRMLSNDLDINLISAITGLTPEQIRDYR